MGDISTGDSSVPMTVKLQEFREQKTQEREQLEAWARIHGVSPPETSTQVKRSTHRFEQWLERQLDHTGFATSSKEFQTQTR